MCVCRKNNVSDFIPDRQPDFPDENFGKVTGDPFFEDESILVKRPLYLRSEPRLRGNVNASEAASVCI